jgi:hypothetical protein
VTCPPEFADCSLTVSAVLTSVTLRVVVESLARPAEAVCGALVTVPDSGVVDGV